MLNLKHLYYFHVFSQEFSTSRAAKRLGITPPALSNQLKQLEESVGLPLTRRLRGRVVCTEHGELVLKFTTRMFDAYQELHEELLAGRDDRKSVLRVGVCQDLHDQLSFDPSLLDQCLGEDHIGRIEFTQDSSENLYAAFIKDHLDEIIGSFGSKESDGLCEVRRTADLAVRVLAPKGTLEGTGVNSDFKQILALSEKSGLFLACNKLSSKLRTEIDVYLKSLKVQPKRVIECSSLSNVVQWIESGRAIGFVPVHTNRMGSLKDSTKWFGPSDGYWQHQVATIRKRIVGVHT